MNNLHKKQTLTNFLESTKSTQIYLPDPILNDIDQFFTNCDQIFQLTTELKPFRYEMELRFKDFPKIMNILNKMTRIMASFKNIRNRNGEIVEFMQKVFKTPFKSLEKIQFLVKLRESEFSLFGTHEHVNDDDFDKGYFFKLTLDPIFTLAEILQTLVKFTIPKPISEDHHQYTLNLCQFFQDLPELLYMAQSEIIPGVVYYAIPPFLNQIKENYEKVQYIGKLWDMMIQSNYFETNLKNVIDNFYDLHQKSQSSGKKLKLEGFINVNPGVNEFRGLIDQIENLKNSLPKSTDHTIKA